MRLKQIIHQLMAFKELTTRRFSVRKYTDKPVNKEETVAIVSIGHIAPDCPQADKKRKVLNEIFEEV